FTLGGGLAGLGAIGLLATCLPRSKQLKNEGQDWNKLFNRLNSMEKVVQPMPYRDLTDADVREYGSNYILNQSAEVGMKPVYSDIDGYNSDSETNNW
ncbi:MAG: hypothetical protein KGJ02_07905, partial [Verrucomicrobiota bacterium]|nr:hypothetical protein [Verrucomicrobiota bacterium]